MSAAIVLKGETASWRQAHEALVRLATERAGLDFEEGRALLTARRTGAHIRLGFASFLEYAERLFGYGPKLTQEKLRVAEALEELPETAGKLQTGAINFSVAREVARVATPSTEKEWLEAARGRTVREVEQLVRGHRPGSLPDDVPDSRLERHVLRLELSGEVFATFREAMAKVRRDAGEPLDDDAACLLLCRRALDGNRDPGRSSYQIALTVCERCRRATQQGRGELVEVGPEILEMAECDAQYVGHVDAHVGVQNDADGRAYADVDDDAVAHVGESPVRATQTIPPGMRRAVLRRDNGKGHPGGCNDGRRRLYNEHVARMSSTAPRDKLSSHHSARAAWLATTSLPRRSTLPPRHRSQSRVDITARVARSARHRPTPSCPRAGCAGAWRAPGARRPKAEHAGRTSPHLRGGIQ